MNGGAANGGGPPGSSNSGEGSDGGGGSETASAAPVTSGRTLKKGPWTTMEDAMLVEYVKKHGEGNWNAVQKNSGLARCGKSCRLRWANHLRPNLKKGAFTPEEERLILELHAKLGNKWARMAAQLPGRTDNEIKNFWNTRTKRRLRQGLPLYPYDIQPSRVAQYCIPMAQSPMNFSQFSFQNASQSPTSLSHTPISHSPALSPHLTPPQQPIRPTYTSSFSLLDQASLLTPNRPLLISPTPPTLKPPLYRFGRLRGSAASPTAAAAKVGFSQSYTPTPSASPLMGSPLSTPLSSMSAPQLSPAAFSPKPLEIMQSQFTLDNVVSSAPGLAMKKELPSSQMFQSFPLNDTGIGLEIVPTGSGLLDDLLKEAQSMVSYKGLLKRDGLEGKLIADEFESWFGDSCGNHRPESTGQWDESSSVRSLAGMKLLDEPMEQMQEDLSELPNALPYTMQAPDWCSNSGEISSGQSSVLTNDEMGLKLQQLTSSFSAPAADNDSCSWNYMPPIC